MFKKLKNSDSVCIWKRKSRKSRLIPELCSRPMTEVILMEIRACGSGDEGGGWAAGFTVGIVLFYSDTAGLASGTQ